MSLVFPELTQVKLIDVNPRSEKHGTEWFPAVDLRFQREMSCAVLNLLHPDLREKLYKDAEQGTLLGPDEVQDGGELRFPELASPFPWKEEVEGYTLTIDYGLGGTSNIELVDCKLHKQVFEAKQGGTAKVSFTVSCSHDLTPEVVGHLGVSIQKDHHIRLVRPEIV